MILSFDPRRLAVAGTATAKHQLPNLMPNTFSSFVETEISNEAGTGYELYD